MELDPELSGFIAEAIPSLWAVELLVRLRHEPERTWSVEALVRELRGSQRLVSDLLRRFETLGLAAVQPDDLWRYAAASPRLDELAAKLEATYRERPAAVTRAIVSGADPVQGFADAFKLRKGPD